MNRVDIYSKLNEIFRDVFDDDDLVVGPDSSAKTVDGWDSIKHIEIIMSVEETFGVRFRSTELDDLKSLADLAEIVARRTPS